MSERNTSTLLLLERYLKLLELSRNLASTLDLSNLLNRIVHSAAELCHAEAASILLYDEPMAQLYFEATSNLDTQEMNGLVVPVESSIAGWILKNRRPLIIKDTTHDPRHFKQIAQITQIVTKSLLGIPLITKDKVIGVLEVINKLEDEFDQEDQDLLIALGAQAAVAIENARLFEQSDMIAELVHEIRTPISAISSAASLINDSRINDQQRQSIVNVMLLELNRLSKLTTEFLELARLESGRIKLVRTSFDVRSLSEECQAIIQGDIEKKEQIFNVIVPKRKINILGDRDKLKQVLLNLLTNASKYTPQQGEITLSVCQQEQEICFKLADNGPGIPQDDLSQIFERFYRGPETGQSESGTGLGLSICQRIIEMHGGRIEVDSQLGKGTVFSIFLPEREETA